MQKAIVRTRIKMQVSRDSITCSNYPTLLPLETNPICPFEVSYYFLSLLNAKENTWQTSPCNRDICNLITSKHFLTAYWSGTRKQHCGLKFEHIVGTMIQLSLALTSSSKQVILSKLNDTCHHLLSLAVPTHLQEGEFKILLNDYKEQHCFVLFFYLE